jgi:hypothetical protein
MYRVTLALVAAGTLALALPTLAQTTSLSPLKIGTDYAVAIVVDIDPSPNFPRTERLCASIAPQASGGAPTDLGCNARPVTLTEATRTFTTDAFVGRTFKVNGTAPILGRIMVFRFPVSSFPVGEQRTVLVSAFSASNESTPTSDVITVDRRRPSIPRAIEIILDNLQSAIDQSREDLAGLDLELAEE